MLSRWVPLFRPRTQPKDKRFRRQLVRSVLFVLLITSLFPILLIGTLNYFRSRELLIQQVSSQIQNVVKFEATQLGEFVDERERAMDRLVHDTTFEEYAYKLLINPSESEEFYSAKTFLYFSLRGNLLNNPLEYYDHILIVRQDRSVAFSADAAWAKENFPNGYIENISLLKLQGTNQSILVYSPTKDYAKKMVLLTSRALVDAQGEVLGTVISMENADQVNNTLVKVSSFVPGSSINYFRNDGKLISLDQSGDSAILLENPKMTPFLKSLIGTSRSFTNFSSTSFQNVPIIAYADWLPDYQVGIVLEVSEPFILRSNNFFDTFNLIVLAGSFLVSGVLVYFGTRRWVTPLTQLSRTVDRFSQGNWEERSNINRTDEIGLLAHSFNQMAGQLSELYHSLESVVEKRTSQLRIASEVAQIATSTTQLSETLGRTVELIAERFGFYHVAVYLTDSAGKSLILREVSGISGDQIKQRGENVAINAETTVGWVAAHNQAKIVSNGQDDPLFHVDPLLPDTLSQLAIPISLGNEVLGVLDIQSTLTDVFDEETTGVFQTMANQISSTLQISRLLESTQISYQETALLYRATRQVTQAHNETEIVQGLTDTFIQLPFISSILSVEGENFKIQVVTDPKTGRVEKSLQSLNIPVGRMGTLLTENRVVLVEDITQASEYDNILSFLLRRGCKSAALVSILENGRLSKVMVYGTREGNQFTNPSLQPYANLAEVIGASLEKYRVLNTLQQRLAELQILASFSQAISAETNLNNLYRVLHQQIIQTLGPDLDFLIGLFNEQTSSIEFPYVYDNGKAITVDPLPLGEGLTSSIIQERKPLLLSNDQEIRSRSLKLIGRAPRSWMGVPLIFAGNIVGAIVIQDLENEDRFNPDDVNLFMTLAPQIATAVRNTQLYTETQQALRAYDQERFLLNTLLDNMPERITFKDTHGRYIRVSDSFAELFNLQPDAMLQKTDFDLMDRDSAEKFFREEQMVMNLGRPEIGRIQAFTGKNGKESWSHMSRIPIRTASGDPYGLLIIDRDISDLKQAEALAQRRAEQMVIAAEIARDTTGTLDVDTLLQKSVNLVLERFGFYHASIFLLEPAGEYAILRESTGPAGQQMMQGGHRLAVGSKSIVGQVTANGQALIVNDVHSDPTHLPNPLLPNTRSELAIPLKTGELVLGALDVQSTQADAFTDEDINVLQILADQLAVAIINGDLFAKTQELLSKHRLLRQLTIAASTTTNMEDTLIKVVDGLRTAMVAERVSILMLNSDGLLQVQASAGYEGNRHLALRLKPGEGIAGIAAQEKRPIRVDDAVNDPRHINCDSDVRSELAIPILFSDELIGVLALESIHLAAFDENDQEILGALGNNLGGVIANIRLVNQVRQQVVRERQLFDVTSKIRHSVDIETILQTSTREIARVLGARRARIQINAGSSLKMGEPQEPELSSKSNGNGAGSNGHSNNGRQNGQEVEE